MRLLIVTDAWAPQVNGVVRSLEQMVTHLTALGDTVEVLSPQGYRSLPLPTYPDIPLTLVRPRRIAARIDAFAPGAVHIATEGPLGLIARRYCLRRRLPFTTSYHTKFPEYVAARLPVPTAPLYAFLRRFHNAACACMVAAPSLKEELSARGFRNLVLWSRGVDTERFRPEAAADLGLERPVFLYVGRVAVEKNLRAFCELDLPGTKVIVGDGPARPDLERAFPDVVFLGTLDGEALAGAYAGADAFVFPSRTDTFGNVLLEALASGLPVAAYPVTGPKDVITDERIGVLDEDLGRAALAALSLSREDARAFALRHDWEASAREFRDTILRCAEG